MPGPRPSVRLADAVYLVALALVFVVLLTRGHVLSWIGIL
ncbi:hypothetical protein EV378_4864 [Pseudonocardia endophytica]|uniref:Uncharacterized protein n=1 Tax=Pseudonocardia endophytica TaxID=401976 RepID=A0A4R1HGQ8_PSEEN|nr:hypothetical protein EV378_4864 [Pseudonocardia endophytica]